MARRPIEPGAWWDVAGRAALIPTGRGADPESSHGELDDLWQDVLEAIRDGRLEGEDARQAAKAALLPMETDPPVRRWYS